MAGLGQRFVDVGYKNPKPFIWVDDDYIISKVVNMFDEEDEIIFICNERHLKETDMYDRLHRLHKNSTVVSVPEHKILLLLYVIVITLIYGTTISLRCG